MIQSSVVFCEIANGDGLCSLPFVSAEPDGAICREAFDPCDIHKGSLEAVADILHAVTVDQQNSLLDDDASAGELNDCVCQLGLAVAHVL